MDKDIDIVIIGSGAGGGACASALAPLVAQGLKVAVLEWGPEFRDAEFTGRELEMAERLYFDGGGVLTKDKSMTLAFCKAYGGSTVVYTGTTLPIAVDTVERWGVPGLQHGDLILRSRKYALQNNVHALEGHLINENNRLFERGCKRLGWCVEQFPLNLKGCQGSGLCNLGCPNAAKQGTHRVQLPAARRAGVEVVTRCRVSSIDVRTRRISARVEACDGVGLPSAWAPGEYRIRADAVIVAAGAVNSPAILLRSGLGAALPALGGYFTCHPALILAGVHGRKISNYHGHPKSFFCDEFAARKRFLLETCMYFPFTTAKNLAGFGQEHESMMADFSKLQMILALALDDALRDNRVSLGRDGEPIVDYRLTEATLFSLVESMRAAARVMFAAGAASVHAPAGRDFSIPRSTQISLDDLINARYFKQGKVSISAAHLMGGCRMGKDASDSVTDSWGQVYGLPWLFVADASLFPKCAEINPYLTIMAMADRVAEAVAARYPEIKKGNNLTYA